jgi:hypothetical protein
VLCEFRGRKASSAPKPNNAKHETSDFPAKPAIFTNPPVTGSLDFVDSSATNWAQRFYRAVQMP